MKRKRAVTGKKVVVARRRSEYWIALVLSIIVGGALIVWLAPLGLGSGEPRVILEDGSSYGVIVAATPQEQEAGLSVYDTFPSPRVMVFPFDPPLKQPIWMYGMKFPIDIIWVDIEGKILHMVQYAPPCGPTGECPFLWPPAQARFIIEAPPGFIASHNLSPGEIVRVERLGGRGQV
ncbi:MAG: DUF192 domain-containing protein [Methanomicrobiales archaeon]|nr:DUF192 domain-containing protein [Methanomicrobiales archaeon]